MAGYVRGHKMREEGGLLPALAWVSSRAWDCARKLDGEAG